MLRSPYYLGVTLPTTPGSAPSTSRHIMAGLAKLSLVMRHEAWRASGRRGLTPTQSQILTMIAGSREPLGIKSIAEHLAVTMGTASEAVSSLVEKGLARKEARADDGRAVFVALTAKGKREASKAAEWPESMLGAIKSLPDQEQAGLLRGLIGMVRSLQEQGAVPTARMCVGCRYFRPNEYPGQSKPHHCRFIDAPIADADLRLDCEEMEPVEAVDRARLWRVFIEGEPFTQDQTGQWRSPKESRPGSHAQPIRRSS